MINGSGVSSMKVEVTQAMNAGGNVYDIRVDGVCYDFFTKEEALAFLEDLNAR